MINVSGAHQWYQNDLRQVKGTEKIFDNLKILPIVAVVIVAAVVAAIVIAIFSYIAFR